MAYIKGRSVSSRKDRVVMAWYHQLFWGRPNGSVVLIVMSPQTIVTAYSFYPSSMFSDLGECPVGHNKYIIEKKG